MDAQLEDAAQAAHRRQQELFVQAERNGEDLKKATERIKNETRQEWIQLLTRPRP